MTEPVQDRQTTNADGTPLLTLPAGVVWRDALAHIDERGMVVEMFDPRWGWHREPLVFSYLFTIRPGWIKGWGMHKRHEDRYFILMGEMELVLYDEREESPTRGLVSQIVLSEYRRGLINIPAGVWHADRNLGSTEVVVVNFPTIQYDHEAPDKYRLPLDSDRIPHRFANPRGS